MLQISSQFRDSYATAYLHQAAWENLGHRQYLIYARIAGKPTFVKAIAGNILKGNNIRIQKGNDILYMAGSSDGRCFYHKHDKIGIITFHSSKVFNHNADSTIILGKDNSFITETFNTILKTKPIVFSQNWNMKKILEDINLINKLNSYNIEAYEVLWNEEKILTHISRLVKDKKLSF